MGTWQAGKKQWVGIEDAQPQSNAIVGARNAEQAVANAKAGNVKLSEQDLQQIDAIGRLVTDHLDDSPGMWTWA